MNNKFEFLKKLPGNRQLFLLVAIALLKCSFSVKAQTVPNTCIDLRAYPSDTSVTLVWDSIVFSTDFASYQIVMQDTPDFFFENYSIITTVSPKGNNSFTINGLQPNTRYYFKINVLDTLGQIDCFSNQTNAQTATNHPNKPIYAWAVPIYPDFFINTYSGYDSRVDFFRVYADTLIAASTLVGTSQSNIDSVIQISGLLPYKNYFFKVVPVDTLGIEMAPSNIFTGFVDTSEVPGPQNFKVKYQNGLKLSWNEAPNFNGFKRYIVYAGDNQFNMLPIYRTQVGNQNDTVYYVSNAPTGIVRYYSVKAQNISMVQSAFADTVSFTYVDTIAPPVPQNLQVITGDKSAFLIWNKVNNIANDFQRYNIYLYQNQSNPQLYTFKIGVNDTTINITGLQNNTTYYANVSSQDFAANQSALSNQVAFVPKDTTGPEKVTVFTTNIDSGKVNLSWTQTLNQAGDFKAYFLYKGLSAQNLALVDSFQNIAATSYVDNQVQNNITYYYLLTAKDTNGNFTTSPPSLNITPTLVEIEPNNYDFNATPFDSARVGKITNSLDVDYFKFTLNGPTQVTIETYPVDNLHPSVGSNIGDTYITLYDSTGINQIAFNDNNPSNVQYPNYSRINQFLTQAGNYYLKVDGAFSSNVGHYVVQITKLEPDVYENNNNTATATALADTQIINNLSIFPANDIDFFTFTAKPNARAVIDIQNPFYTGTIKMRNHNNIVLQTVNANNLNFVVPDSTPYYFSYELNGFTTPNYILDFKIIPPINYADSFLITEIYHADTAVQFIEVFNKHHAPINLKGFRFPELNLILPNYNFLPKSYLVVANDSSKFYNKYGFYPDFDWNNSQTLLAAQTITFNDSNNALVDFVPYTNGGSFPGFTPNEQFSLEIKDLNLNNNLGNSWKKSSFLGGTPKHFNSIPSMYAPDGFENNNTLNQAKLLTYPDSLFISLSELVDTADWFIYRLRKSDTLNFTISKLDSNLLVSMFIIDPSNNMVGYHDSLTLHEQIQFIAPAEDTFYIVFKPIADGKQFVTNEGFIKFETKKQEAIIQSPYFEDFENTPVGFLPAGYRVYNLDGNNSKWEKAFIPVGVNNSSGLFVSANVTGNNDWVILPPMLITQDDAFSFYSRPSSVQFPETNVIYIAGRNANKPSDFITVLDSIVVDSTSHKKYNFDLAPYFGQVVRIAIRNISVNKNQQYVDNINLAPPFYNAVLRGTITDLATNQPISGVKVVHKNEVATSNTSGFYQLEEITYGTQKITFSKTNYTPADYNISFNENDTITFNVEMIKNNLDSFYVNNFDNPGGRGFQTVFSGTNVWRKSAGITYQTNSVNPQSPDSMWIIGGNSGYNNSVSNNWVFSAGAGFNFSQYQKVDLYFDYNHQIDTSDYVFLLGNGSFIIDLNNDSIGDSLDAFTGNSNGWQSKHVELSYLNNFSDLELSLWFLSNQAFNQGFGFAVDNVVIVGQKEIVKQAPRNFTATSFQVNHVPLSWQIDSGNVQYFKVFKSQENNPYTILTQTTDTSFVDSAVVNGQFYSYYVTAVYPFGESKTSNAAVGNPGVPQTINLPYANNFNNLTDTLPAKWGYFRSNNNPWLVGDSADAKEFNNLFSGKTNFVFANFFSIGNIGEYYESILSTPWFNTGNVNNRVILGFDAQGASTNEYHTVVYRNSLASPWQVLDTIPGSWQWKTYRYDVTNLANNSTYFQVGFMFQTDSNFLNSPNLGWAIDNFSITQQIRGNLQGTVYSQTGSTLPNFTFQIFANNNQIWNVSKEFTVTTDSLGQYTTPVNSLYGGQNYSVRGAYWYHDSLIENNINLITNPQIQDFTLEIDLPQPLNLTVKNDSIGNPILNWQTPKLIGELKYDDGIFFSSDSLSPGAMAGAIFYSDAPNNLKLNQISIYAKAKANACSLRFYGFGILPNGLPNTADTIFVTQNYSVQNTTFNWNFFNLNESLDTNNFYLVVHAVAGTGQHGVNIGFTQNLGSTNSVWRNNPSSNFFNKASAIMIRAYQEVGNFNFNYNSAQFNGTYNVYRFNPNTTIPNLIKLDSNFTQYTFTDYSLNLGDTAVYLITAITSFGESRTSNLVIYVMQGLPYLKVLNTQTTSVLPYLINNHQHQFTLRNIGIDTLTYQVTYKHGYTENHKIDSLKIPTSGLKATKVLCFENPMPGDTVELNLYIENRNTTGERLKSVEIQFPQGINVLSSTNAQVIGASRFLISSGNTGMGINLAFNDPNIGQTGEINQYEVALAKVLVAIDTNANLPFNLSNLIKGDAGSLNQNEVVFRANPIQVNIPSNTGFLVPNSQFVFNTNITIVNPPITGGRYPGYYQILSNDSQNTAYKVPAFVEVESAKGTFRGLVTDNVDNDPIANAQITVGNFSANTNSSGWFFINDVPVGQYQIFASHNYFENSSAIGSILNHFDTSTVLISMKPKVLDSENLKATGNINQVDLSWQLKNHELFYDCELPFGKLEPEVDFWLPFDADSTGNSWQYSGVGAFEGSYCLAVESHPSSKSSDWLISKQVRITEANAMLEFYAAPQDINVSEERFVVRLSSQSQNINHFTDSLFAFKFPPMTNAWQKFQVPLGQYTGDSVFIAIHYTSQQQFKLRIDAIKFISAQLAEEPLDLGIYKFNIFRSQNNGSFSIIDSVTANNDSVFYTDNAVLTDTLYTYYVKSVIPQINRMGKPSNFASVLLLRKDAGAVAINKPQTGRNLTKKQPVEIKIRNLGTDSIYPTDSITVSYQINGGPIYTQPFLPTSAIASNQSVDVLMTDSANISTIGNYSFKAWTSLKNDNNFFNDTITKLVKHKPDTLLPPPWDVNPFNYQYNMSITAETFIWDTLSRDSADILAAFVGNQVRGVAKVEYISAFNRWVAQLTVYSNLSIENVTFKIWDASRDSVFDIIESYTFINNQIYGSLSNPVKLTTTTPTQFYDIGLSKILSPVNGQNQYTNAEKMRVQLKNFGSLDFSQGDSVRVFYKAERKGVTLRSGSEKIVFSQVFGANDTLNFQFAPNVNMTDTGTYQFTFYTKRSPDYDKTNDTIKSSVTNIPVNEPNWNVNPANFQYSAFLTAKVFFDDILSIDNRDKVAALVNGQVRGVANVEYQSAFGEYVIQMAIYSNALSGEKISFKAFDYSKNSTLDVIEKYSFSNNAIWGTLVNPQRLHAETGYNGINDVENDINKVVQIFPNPVSDVLFVLPMLNQKITVEFYDVAGQKVFELADVEGLIEIPCKNLADGVYQLKIGTNNNWYYKKVVLVK